MKKITTIALLLLVSMVTLAESVNIVTLKGANNRVQFAAEYLQKKLEAQGFTVVLTSNSKEDKKCDHRITLDVIKDAKAVLAQDAKQRKKDMRRGYPVEALDSFILKKEGFTISAVTIGSEKRGLKARIDVVGNDATGCIYGCNELAEQIAKDGITNTPGITKDAPEMVLRGGCIGVQKPYLLPGRMVYEYPYTPDLFPWFYDKQHWIDYLNMLVDNRMNSLYLWNGHPFASLVKLKDYPFAVEVDDATFEKNKEMFSFITKEADKRGIFVIQMFYNIIVSKPFADHYGIKTQDRHRPIDALDGKIQDYTYKSIKAFIENYPNVGLLVCLGEAMDTYEDDVNWMTKTILPAVKDGLKTLGRTDEPPVLLRAHDTDCKMVMDASLPIYHNLYTMSKYTGESLTTYEPQGPWAETHRQLAALGSTHIENVHILANLEPWRWSSPEFIQKTVNAMHNVHNANALHLYPQASYWDWPYTADKLADGKREKQLDRDWMWYEAWGRYSWNCHRDHSKEVRFWNDTIADVYGTSIAAAGNIREALDESGEIAPMLLRRFGITEGNRQSLLLGMFCSQLVNPYKYTVYPDFYESCGPDGLKLIDYVARKYGKPAPKNFNFSNGTTSAELMAKPDSLLELPLTAVKKCMEYGDAAVRNIDAVRGVTKNKDEFNRLKNDIHCYREFAYAFGLKVQACEHVLDYKYTNNIADLEKAIPLLEQSLDHYRKLVDLTKDTYLYCQSMQTSMRRIPIAGDDGKMKHWTELLPKYEQELANLQKNIDLLKNSPLQSPPQSPEGEAGKKSLSLPREGRGGALHNAKVSGLVINSTAVEPIAVANGTKLFTDLDSTITAYATELTGMNAYSLASKVQRDGGTTISYTCDKPTTILVGYFRDDQRKYAQAPKLEIDATASEYGQQEPCYTSALRINGMPQMNIHPYNMPAGNVTLRLPKGILCVLGITSDKITPRDAGLSGTDSSIDWLFY